MVAPVKRPWAWAFVASFAPCTALAAGAQAPFEPPVANATGAPEARARGVPAVQGLRTGSAAAVLIDGRWLRVGQSVAGGRLLAVGPDGAIFRAADGSRHRLVPAAPAPRTDAAPGPSPDGAAQAVADGTAQPTERKMQ